MPLLQAEIGAVATQSISNRYLGPRVLDAMAAGLSPDLAVAAAAASDEGRGLRQLHAVDRHRRTPAWTDANCVTWCGSVADHAVSVAGNMLANASVVPATLAAFAAADGDLAEWLMAGMDAGEVAGGDRRGRQSAALVITTTEDFPDLSIRAYDHDEPLVELRRLLGVWRRERAPGLQHAPRKAAPAGLIDLDAIEAPWIAAGLDLRLRR